MIVNNMHFKLKDRSGDSIDKAKEVLMNMKGKIDSIYTMQVEVCTRPSQMTYDILMISKYKTQEDFQAYLVHPLHVEVGNYIKDAMDGVSVVSYVE